MDGNRIQDVMERLGRAVREKAPEGNPTPEQMVEALNEATSGNWSLRTERESGQPEGPLGELFRFVIKMGDPSDLRVKAIITVPASDGVITREGEATGKDDYRREETEMNAIARAIRTMLPGSTANTG